MKAAGTADPEQPRCCQKAALDWHALTGAPLFMLHAGEKAAGGIKFTQGHIWVSGAGDVARAFPKDRDYNIGWRTGHTGLPASLIAFDLDVKDGKRGPETFAAMAFLAGILDRAEAVAIRLDLIARRTGAVVVRTPSGGYHFIYSIVGLPDFYQRIGRIEEVYGQGHGIDIRARNGYCLAPGSWVAVPDRGRVYYELVFWPPDRLGPGPLPAGLMDWLVPYDPATDSGTGRLSIKGINGHAQVRLNGELVSTSGGVPPEAIEDALRHILSPKCAAACGYRDLTGYKIAAYLRVNMDFDYTLTRQLLEVWAEKNTQPNPGDPITPSQLDRLARQGETGTGIRGGKRWDLLFGSIESISPEEVIGWRASEEAARQQAWEEVGGGQQEPPPPPPPPPPGGSQQEPPKKEPPRQRRDGPANGFKVRYASVIDENNVSWLIPGVVARGKLNIILGEGGQGKSQLTIALAAAVSRGLMPGAAIGAAFGWQEDGGAATLFDTPFQAPPERGLVVFIADEDDWRDTMKPRIHAAGCDRDNVQSVEASFKWDDKKGQWKVGQFALSDDAAALGQFLKENPDCRMIVIDPLNAYLGPKADSYKAADVRAVLNEFQGVAQKYGVAILAVMHPNKRKEGHVASWISGSAAFGQLARAVWAVIPDPEDADFKDKGRRNQIMTLAHAKGNLGSSSPTGLKFLVEGYDYLRADGALTLNTSRVVFQGRCDLTADQVAAGPKDEGGADATGGGDWQERLIFSCANELRRFLEENGGSVNYMEMDTWMKAHSYTKVTMVEARGRLGLIYAKHGLDATWSLPYDPQEVPPGGIPG